VILAGETLDQFENFVSLWRRKFHEPPQQPQALDNFAGWSSECVVQL